MGEMIVFDDCLGCRARRTALAAHRTARGSARRATRSNLALADIEVALRHHADHVPRNLLVDRYRQQGWGGPFDVVDDPIQAAHALARAEAGG